MWVEKFSKQHNRPYWKSSAGEVSWLPPQGMNAEGTTRGNEAQSIANVVAPKVPPVESPTKPVDIVTLESPPGVRFQEDNISSQASLPATNPAAVEQNDSQVVVAGGDSLQDNNNNPNTDEGDEINPNEFVDQICQVKSGCFMIKKKGQAGPNPARDKISFMHAPTKWISLDWSGPRETWKIWYYNQQQPVASASGQPLGGTTASPTKLTRRSSLMSFSSAVGSSSSLDIGKFIALSNIDDLYLEPAPSPSFRVYCDDSTTVVQFTPQPPSPATALLWFEAIFAAIQLQSCDQSIIDNLRNDKYDRAPPVTTPDMIAASSKEPLSRVVSTNSLVDGEDYGTLMPGSPMGGSVRSGFESSTSSPAKPRRASMMARTGSMFKSMFSGKSKDVSRGRSDSRDSADLNSSQHKPFLHAHSTMQLKAAATPQNEVKSDDSNAENQQDSLSPLISEFAALTAATPQIIDSDANSKLISSAESDMQNRSQAPPNEKVSDSENFIAPTVKSTPTTPVTENPIKSDIASAAEAPNTSEAPVKTDKADLPRSPENVLNGKKSILDTILAQPPQPTVQVLTAADSFQANIQRSMQLQQERQKQQLKQQDVMEVSEPSAVRSQSPDISSSARSSPSPSSRSPSPAPSPRRRVDHSVANDMARHIRNASPSNSGSNRVERQSPVIAKSKSLAAIDGADDGKPPAPQRRNSLLNFFSGSKTSPSPTRAPASSPSPGRKFERRHSSASGLSSADSGSGDGVASRTEEQVSSRKLLTPFSPTIRSSTPPPRPPQSSESPSTSIVASPSPVKSPSITVTAPGNTPETLGFVKSSEASTVQTPTIATLEPTSSSNPTSTATVPPSAVSPVLLPALPSKYRAPSQSSEGTASTTKLSQTPVQSRSLISPTSTGPRSTPPSGGFDGPQQVNPAQALNSLFISVDSSGPQSPVPIVQSPATSDAPLLLTELNAPNGIVADSNESAYVPECDEQQLGAAATTDVKPSEINLNPPLSTDSVMLAKTISNDLTVVLALTNRSGKDQMLITQTNGGVTTRINLADCVAGEVHDSTPSLFRLLVRMNQVEGWLEFNALHPNDPRPWLEMLRVHRLTRIKHKYSNPVPPSGQLLGAIEPDDERSYSVASSGGRPLTKRNSSSSMSMSTAATNATSAASAQPRSGFIRTVSPSKNFPQEHKVPQPGAYAYPTAAEAYRGNKRHLRGRPESVSVI